MVQTFTLAFVITRCLAKSNNCFIIQDIRTFSELKCQPRCQGLFLFSIWRPAVVTVIKASPRFGHPHSQNPSDMGIPSHITLAIWVRVSVTGDAIPLGFREWGCPKRGEAHISVTPLPH